MEKELKLAVKEADLYNAKYDEVVKHRVWCNWLCSRLPDELWLLKEFWRNWRTKPNE